MGDKTELKKMQKVLLHPEEAKLHLRLFNEMPVRAIATFLECFDEDGRQAFEVPPHVLTFMQERLRSFMQGDFPSIDKAFGGGAARQRKTIKRVGSDGEILWDLKTAWDEIKKNPNGGRGETPYERAVRETASKHNKSEDAVRDVYKRSKKQ